MRGGKKRIDENLVFDLYSNNISIKDIASKLNCTYVNINYILRTKFGLNRKIQHGCSWCDNIPENLIGVYSITNKVNNKFYIGSSNDIWKRIVRYHYPALLRGKGIVKELQEDFDKYGSHSFCCDILATCSSIEDAIDIEYKLLSFDNLNLYNINKYTLDIKKYINENRIRNFKRKIQKTDTCWNFTGGLKNGYGCLYFYQDGIEQRVLAHRFSYEIHNGSCGNSMVGHKCNNKICVNPEHLYLTNHGENNKYSWYSSRGLVSPKQAD